MNELIENHLDILEKEFQGSLHHVISPRMFLSKNQLFEEDRIYKINWFQTKSEDSEGIELNEFLRYNNHRTFIIRAATGMGKSTLSK